MKILALDSSGLVASVAILEDENIIAEYTLNYKKTHSQTLLPMLENVREMLDLDLESLDAIAVAAGPGSFTGLRIGSATAKGLAQALGKPIIPVPTLEGLAHQMYGWEHLICPIMDARRGQVYTGIYEFKDHKLHVLLEQSAIEITDLVEQLNTLGRSVMFLGDGVIVYQEALNQGLNIQYAFAPPHKSKQSAAAIAVAGKTYVQENKMVEAKDHAPIYLRMSQAERERLEKEKSLGHTTQRNGEYNEP